LHKTLHDSKSIGHRAWGIALRIKTGCPWARGMIKGGGRLLHAF